MTRASGLIAVVMAGALSCSAQMGLLPQVHRRDRDIYANIAWLLERAGRSMPPFENVPNRYLK